MDFISNLIKRPNSTAHAKQTNSNSSSSSNSVIPAVPSSEAPLINLAMDKELEKLFESAAEDLDCLEEQHKYLVDIVAEPSQNITTPPNPGDDIKQLLTDNYVNLDEVSANELEHLQAMSLELSPLAVKPSPRASMEQQKALVAALRSTSQPGTPTVPLSCDPFKEQQDVEQPVLKFTGLPEFDETQIPELAPFNAEMEGQFKANVCAPAFSSTALKLTEADYNSDSDVYAECAEHSELEAYSSALNEVLDHQLSSATASTLENTLSDAAAPSHNNSCEPMDVDELNVTIEMLKDVLAPEDHQKLQQQLLELKEKQLMEQGAARPDSPSSHKIEEIAMQPFSPPIPTHREKSPEELKVLMALQEFEQPPLQQKKQPTVEQEKQLDTTEEKEQFNPVEQVEKQPLSVKQSEQQPEDWKQLQAEQPSTKKEQDIEVVQSSRPIDEPLEVNISDSTKGRISAPTSPMFPIKEAEVMPAHFPRSPHAPPEHEEMIYLEQAVIEPSAERKQSLCGVLAKSPLPLQVVVTPATPESPVSPEKPVEGNQELASHTAAAEHSETFSEQRRTFSVIEEQPQEEKLHSDATAIMHEQNSEGEEKQLGNESKTSDALRGTFGMPHEDAISQQRRTFSIDQQPLQEEKRRIDPTPIMDFKKSDEEEQGLDIKNTDAVGRRATFGVPLEEAISQQRRTFSIDQQPLQEKRQSDPTAITLFKKSDEEKQDLDTENSAAAGRRATFGVPLEKSISQQRRTFSVTDQQSLQDQNRYSDTTAIMDFTAEKADSVNDEYAKPFGDVMNQQRRTFLITEQQADAENAASPAMEATEENTRCESFEPMDVDVSVREEIALSPPIPTHKPKQQTAELATLLVLAQGVELPPSPPKPTQTEAQWEQYSPPIPTHQPKEQRREQQWEQPMEQKPERDSPPLPTHHKQLPQSPPLPAQLKRPAIHPDVPVQQLPSPIPNPNEEQALSAKEQLSASDEKEDVFVEHFGAMSPITDDIFKAPQYTSSAFNSMAKSQRKTPADGATSAEDQFYDAEFQDGASNNNIILNSSDFDYLSTKGSYNGPVDRSSLLLKFDPLLGGPVPVNQYQQQEQQQQLLQILSNNLLHNNNNNNNNNNNLTRALSPTLEEHESSGSNQSFVIEPSAKTETELEAGPGTGAGDQEPEYKPPVDRTKKHAKMSVDVIDNDCNKTLDNSNLNSEDKTHKYNNMDELEKKIKNEVTRSEDIEKKLKEAEQREEALVKRITEKDKTNTKLNGVIEAYEKAIAELIHDKEQLVQNHERQMQDVRTDRDSNYHHLTSLETTFSDLHVKYEKSKAMTSQLRQIEENLLEENKKLTDKLRQQEQRYEQMKSHAMQQMEIANKKLATFSKDHMDEVKKLKALLKKEEVSRISTAEQLQQKSRENADLLKICEELIYDKGQGSSS